MDSEQPSQTFSQGQRKFMQERSRTAAMKRAEAQHPGHSSNTQVKSGEVTAPSAPARHRYAGGQGKYTPAQTVRGAAPVSRPVRDGGQTVVKTARSGRKTAERTAKQTIKTAEYSSRQAVKTTQRTAKTAQQTVKTAQVTAKSTQQTVQTARATAKAAATNARATARAAIAAAKAAVAAAQALAAVIATTSLPVLLVVVVVCLVGLIAASPFGIFFGIFFPGGGGSLDTVSPSAAITEISSEYADRLSTLQTGGSHDRAEIRGGPPAWTNVLAVFSAKTTAGSGTDVAVLDADKIALLKTVFWDMTKITTSEVDVEHPAEGDAPAWTEKVLIITVTPRTPDDMRVFYNFTEEQNAALDELLSEENSAMWRDLLYGNSSDIVAVALSQVGNVGGQPYWSWYGFDSRVEWCACFVSWCANECGYIDAGVIPKFAGCTGGSNWFKDRGQWQGGGYEPRPGDLVFFDWDEKGSSGPQDDVPDHVGIVERVENGVVYTVEGNSGDSCRQNAYSVGHYEIWGYATPVYN